MSKDTIYKQDAIDLFAKQLAERCGGNATWWKPVAEALVDSLPPAKPEIIRCKDCKYRDENWRRVSVRWLPCMDVRTGSNWYCGSAERGEQDG